MSTNNTSTMNSCKESKFLGPGKGGVWHAGIPGGFDSNKSVIFFGVFLGGIKDSTSL